MRALVILAVLLLVAFPAAAGLNLPGGITKEATGPSGAAVEYAVTATGTGSGDDHNGRPRTTPEVACSPASGSTFAIGTTTVSCTASSSEGTSSGSFDVTVQDTTAPVLQLNPSITVEATSPNGATVAAFVNAAHDLVDGARSVVCTPGPGLFPVGTTLVSCTAADSRGNGATGTFTVTVNPQPETTPPSLTVPADITAEATGASGAVVTFSVSANGTGGDDDQNGRPGSNITTSCSPASGSTFALGITSVTCTATNSAGTTSRSFNVTVADTTAPSLRLPRDLTVQASSADGEVVTFTASATDLVDGSVNVDCSPASGATFAVGATTVTCTATDSRGNNATGSFTVTVTAPDAPPPPPGLNLPDDITTEATGPGGAVVTFTATSGGSGNDDHNGRPDGSVTCSPASGALFALGTTTVNCTAGSASGSFDVTVVDTTAPELALPADITTADPVVTFTASATDLVDGSVAVTCAPASGSTFAAGTTNVVCTAADSRGNDATGSFSVTVTGPSARTITVSATPDKLWPPDHKMVDVTITVTASDNTAVTAEIVAVSSTENDPADWNVTGALTVQLRAKKDAQAKVRVYAIDVKVIDIDGNETIERVEVTVTNASSSSTASRTRTPTGRW